MNRAFKFYNNTQPLIGKWVAITGATGGLGQELCFWLAELGANLILMDRNKIKSDVLIKRLESKFPTVVIKQIILDLSEIATVQTAAEKMKNQPIDILIHNAGAYSIPRKTCDTGLDNVFQINFASPYFLTKALLPALEQRNGRVIVVGSIAHNYSKTDVADPDFSTRKAASKVYGNAKRFLMGSMYELLTKNKKVTLAVVHPGITMTGITAHYPKWLYAIIRHPMKIIFMKPKKAVLCLLKGIFEDCKYLEWIGPKWFDIWGLPKKRKLKTISKTECQTISSLAEEIYNKQSRLLTKKVETAIEI